MRWIQKIRKHVLFPLLLRRRGDLAQLEWLREFEKTQFLSPEEIQQLQLQRLQRLLTGVERRSPAYQERFQQAGIQPKDIRSLDEIRQIPILEKSHLQEGCERFIARDWPTADLIRNQTGGSTGAPISFYLTQDRRRSRAAATLRHNQWAGWEVGDRAAILWGAPQDAPETGWKSRLRQALLGEPIWLDTSHITEEKMESFHSRLHAYRPKVLQAYARSLLLFARFLDHRDLKPYQPELIVISAEGLEDEERAYVERVFGCPIFNRYGCRELSVIASECSEHNGLHVMAEGLLVEILCGNRPAQPGEIGSIVITDLLNEAMPLIRYRIGDMGCWAKGSCRCGRGLPRIEKLHGRMTDFLVGSDDRLVSGVFLATYVVAQRPALGQVQIRQSQPGAITYRICAGRDFSSEKDLPYLVAASQQYLGKQTKVTWEMVSELPRETSGKFLFSASTVAPKYVKEDRDHNRSSSIDTDRPCA